MRFILMLTILFSGAVSFAASRPCVEVTPADYQAGVAADGSPVVSADLPNDNALPLPENVDISIIKTGAELGIDSAPNAEAVMGTVTVNTNNNQVSWNGKPLPKDPTAIPAQEILCNP